MPIIGGGMANTNPYSLRALLIRGKAPATNNLLVGAVREEGGRGSARILEGARAEPRLIPSRKSQLPSDPVGRGGHCSACPAELGR